MITIKFNNTMKRILTILLTLPLFFLFPVQASAQNTNSSAGKNTTFCKAKRSSFSNLPPRGGRSKMATGIEGRIINFGFDLGGSFGLMDALSREKAFVGAKGSVFVHAIIPNTRTLAIGLEGGFTYLLANEQKYKETLTASTRDGATATSKEAQVTVGNWMLPTAQVSFMGNFHPAQRFNIQVKGNIGVVLAMVPKYEAEYYVKDIQSDGTYAEIQYHYVYNNDLVIGLSATIGTKLLYALTNHMEFGIGLDWSYLRFSYEKGWVSPEIKVTKELTQFGVFDLHVGLAFSF